MIAAERSKRSWPDSLQSGPITDLPLRSLSDDPILETPESGQGWGRRVTGPREEEGRAPAGVREEGRGSRGIRVREEGDRGGDRGGEGARKQGDRGE